MQETINKNLSWNIIGEDIKEISRVLVTKGSVNSKGDTLILHVSTNIVVPYSDLQKIKEDIINSIPALSEVEFLFDYGELVQPSEKAALLYLPHLTNMKEKNHKILTNTIYMDEITSVREEGVLKITIPVLGEVTAEKGNEELKEPYEKLMGEVVNEKILMTFVNHEKNYEKAREEKRARMFEDLKENELKRKEANKRAERGYGRKRDILGRAVKGEPKPIKDIDVSEKKVCIEGRLFKITSKTIRNNLKLVNLLVTDRSSSVCCRLYLNEEKFVNLEENLLINDWLKIEGEPEWDTFENAPVIKTLGIQRENMVMREDDAPLKRVELHLHTKMSENDGLIDIEELLDTSIYWGHEAVAITDHGVVQAFPEAYQLLKNKEKEYPLKLIYGMEGYLYDDLADEVKGITRENTYHIVLLAKDQRGLKNLYELVTESHLNHLYYKRPRIPKSVLKEKREGLFIGSACEAGEVFRAVLKNLPFERQKEIAGFYDYLEIMPRANNQFLIDKNIVDSDEDLKNLNKAIVKLGEACLIPVVATTDAHYKDPEDSVYRRIIQVGRGYKDAESNKGLFMRTTEEMLEEFSYLGEEKAYETVITNPLNISKEISRVVPLPSGKFPPKIENSDEILKKACYDKAFSIYGEPLPERIKDRLERELSAIIGNGYAVMYVSSKMVVEKSLKDGYLVGSRGSVGSSFVATMAGITEVNPLPPHYICGKCKYLEWGDIEKYDCGVDMPDKTCPLCGTVLNRQGFSIPFETFLGFGGEKEPDIDINFAGEYQLTAHKYIEELFGKGNVFKAGTIGTIQDRIAYGYVKTYQEEAGEGVSKWEVERLVQGCSGIKRTTGQHPGGIIIVPEGHNIHEFCPVQHPANDSNSEVVTTHFDYHSIDKNLLKLDLLGHDVPSQIRHLQDMTGVDPLSFSMSDPAVLKIFRGTESLNIKERKYRFTHGTYGIPEFGTEFVRRMLDDTMPENFADLVRISGFSHGTDVWNNNARELIKQGIATMRDAISTRDDIMNYLIMKGLPKEDAFSIMERVRKGRGVTLSEEEALKKKGVKEWYIESLKKIKYVFPRAHAVAYVMMSYRIAWYKVYYPLAFYAAFFTTKKDFFNLSLINEKPSQVFDKITELLGKGKAMTDKEANEIIVLEVMYEMMSRGYEFEKPDLGKSHPTRFMVADQKVLVSLAAIPGVGEAAARLLKEEYENSPYKSVDEIRTRGKLNSTAISALRELSCLDGIPESDQLTLFDMQTCI